MVQTRCQQVCPVDVGGAALWGVTAEGYAVDTIAYSGSGLKNAAQDSGLEAAPDPNLFHSRL